MARLLEVRDLSVGVEKDGKTYNAVNKISFSIDEGEIVGLSGESGCGKTMTAMSIPNLLPQAAKITGGEIIYNGIPLTSLGEKQFSAIRGREISVVFQEVRQSLNPLMRSGRQITEMLELSGETDKAKNKALALETLFSLGFEDPQKIFDAYPHQLSGGMCQRVMTAIASISRPRLLLADEPSSALDKESQERILSSLMKMNRDFNTAVLVISHDLSIIRRFAGRFLVMYAGRIVEEGRTSALFSPLHPYTSALIGAIPGKDKHGKNLESIGGKVPSIEDSFSGCPFAPRCPKVQNICMETFPPVTEMNGGRVNCFFPHTGDNDD